MFNVIKLLIKEFVSKGTEEIERKSNEEEKTLIKQELYRTRKMKAERLLSIEGNGREEKNKGEKLLKKNGREICEEK